PPLARSCAVSPSCAPPYGRCAPAASFASLVFCYLPSPPSISTLSLHDALPISMHVPSRHLGLVPAAERGEAAATLDHIAAVTRRSEEHTSELQSRFDLVCRLLLEKKK